MRSRSDSGTVRGPILVDRTVRTLRHRLDNQNQSLRVSQITRPLLFLQNRRAANTEVGLVPRCPSRSATQSPPPTTRLHAVQLMSKKNLHLPGFGSWNNVRTRWGHDPETSAHPVAASLSASLVQSEVVLVSSMAVLMCPRAPLLMYDEAVETKTSCSSSLPLFFFKRLSDARSTSSVQWWEHSRRTSS